MHPQSKHQGSALAALGGVSIGAWLAYELIELSGMEE